MAEKKHGLRGREVAIAHCQNQRQLPFVQIILWCFFICLFASSAYALSIAEPAGDIVVTATPTSVDAAWDGNATNYSVMLVEDDVVVLNTSVSTNSTSLTVEEASYVLIVSDGTDTANTSFTVSIEATLPELVISAEESSYTTGQNVYLSASTDKPVSAELTILLEGETVETYTLSLESNINLIYIPEDPGSYTVKLAADGASATTAFTVTAIEELAVDFDYTTPQINQRTNFTADVSGGQTPYSYTWLFSDDTSSTGGEVSHYFFTPGDHSATLVVTDGENTQKSITKNFTVNDRRYDLEVTVVNKDNLPLDSVKVEIIQNTFDDEDFTNSAGTAYFYGVKGRYNLTVTFGGDLYVNETINISEDESILYTINYTSDVPFNTTSTTNTTTNETINETVANNTPDELDTTSAVEEIVEATPTQTGPSEEELRQEALEQKKEEAAQTVQQREFDLKLSAQKDRVIEFLGLQQSFTKTKNEIQTALSEEEIDTALSKLIKDITITDERTTVEYPTKDDVEMYIEQFLEAQGIVDEDLAAQYRYSANYIAENVSVRTVVMKAEVTAAGKTDRYTIVEREVTSPAGTYTVEMIPKAFAASAQQLTIAGAHTVIQDDPVIKFTDKKYGYAVAKNTEEIGYPLVLPNTLLEPGKLLGFFSVSLGEGSGVRSIIYIFIIVIAVAGLVVGKKIAKQRADEELFGEFAHLAEDALQLIHDGQHQKAASLTPHIFEIFDSLPVEHQKELDEVMKHLDLNEREQNFLGIVSEVYETIATQGSEINIVSTAYERALGAYEHLPSELQERMQTHIDQLHTYLDDQLTE